MTHTPEGTTRTITEIYTRHECEQCGEPATVRHSYLMKNARHNPASSGYGKDDISWCSDGESFVCDNCPRPKHKYLEWCSTFSGERFPKMLHYWLEVSRQEWAPEQPPASDQ